MTEKILSIRWVYIVMAFILFIFQIRYRFILNFPFVLNLSLFFFCYLIMLVFLYRYNHNQKENKNSKTNKLKKYQKNDWLIDLFGCLVLAFFIFMIIKTSFNFYLEIKADNSPTQEMKLPISNYISGRVDLLYYHFEDKSYTLGYSNPDQLKREEIIDHYVLNIEYSKSVLGMYVIKKYNVEPK